MKRYRITLEGQTFDVKVLDDPRRNQVRVEVDGEAFTVGVDAVPVVTEVVAGEVVQAAAPARLPKSSETLEVSAGPDSAPPSGPPEVGAGVLPAPLPGVIKSITVRPGEKVAANDELLVIEAMKMDNVIRAVRGGTIGVIHVSEGRRVAYGEPLLEMNSE